LDEAGFDSEGVSVEQEKGDYDDGGDEKLGDREKNVS